MTETPDRVGEIFAAIDTFQRTHRLPGLQHAQIRGLLAEHLARVLPAAVAVRPPATDRTALREQVAEAIRAAACPGDCGKTEEECARERIQPFAWHHGRLAVVEGEPEQFADAVLAVLPAPAARAAVLLWAADHLDADMERFFREWPDEPRNSPYALGRKDAAAELRRLAAVPAAVSGRADDETRVFQSEPEPPTPRCAHCRHPKRDHDGHADHRERYSPLVAGGPWCHACNVECDYAAEPAVGGAQPKEAGA